VRHLVAYFGNEPENLACALFPARPALHAQGERLPRQSPDGFGLGFVQGGDVLLQKRPRVETSEVDLYGLVKDTRADALIGRIGLGRDGNTAAEDADPFRYRSWLFASIGDLDESAFEAIRERVLESTPAFLRRNIRGKSPSEHIFHLFLAFLHDAGILDQPTPPPTAVHAALRNSLAFIDRLLIADGAAALQIAICATNGRCFVATGSDYPIRYLQIEGIADCPVCLERTDTNHTRRRIPHEGLRAIIVEANRDVAVRSGWQEVPNHSALIAGADRVPQISGL
jgi:predicted glutamine amidotransferase